ncbi:MAG TPA: thiazole synthase [Phycisphaerales bacterium]|nr:thiazole synthase [Phycisphaerales bacterium]HMP38695.1 thiazole synthase [Phycisphaerales bacterium]
MATTPPSSSRGSPASDDPVAGPPPLRIGGHVFTSRLIVGTGKFSTPEIMRDALGASGAEVVTVAVRRERLLDASGKSLLESLDTGRITILPNTAGCFDAEDAIRVARLGREILDQLDNPGRDWVKLEVLGDRRTLLPDPVGTLEACRALVADGFTVLCYSSDDPIMAMRLRDAGAASVMPAGSPIGSGRGIANAAAISIILELLKDPASGGDPEYPVVVDAGVGTPSDVVLAMELGSDGVLLNTGIAHARDPVAMARAMRLACESGWLGARAGRIPRRLYASASSPWEGTIAPASGAPRGVRPGPSGDEIPGE